MSDDFHCPFCGSDSLKIDTPYLVRSGGHDYTDIHQKEQTYCCKTQAKNQEYIKKRYHPTFGEKPDSDEVSKL